MRVWERWLLMVSQAADSLDGTQPCLSLLEPGRNAVNRYREQGRYRAGHC